MEERLRPQQATGRNADVRSVEWLFEPSWPGERLLARVAGDRVSLTDASGAAADDAFPEVAGVLASAVNAGEALLDGVWSAQPFVGAGSPARVWAETLESEGLADEVPDPLEEERRRAFVAIDLVELDGESLNEVPFQERRRLLESVIEESVQVRLSPLVRQPIGGWLTGWRENGFRRYLAKHMNSRYRPGTVTDDWLEIPLPNTPAPRGFASTLLGGRERRPRVRD